MKMQQIIIQNEHMQPPEGFDRIKQIFDGDADAAWYWLTVPNDALDGEKPLVLLRKGEVARVEAAAGVHFVENRKLNRKGYKICRLNHSN